MKKKLILEAKSVISPNKTGVGDYTDNLISAYSQLDKTRTIKLACFKRSSQEKLNTNNKYELKENFIPFKLANRLNHYRLMPRLDLFFGSGIYMYPNFSWWPSGNSPSVCVIHDLVCYTHPETMDQNNLKFLLKDIPRAIQKSNAIIAVSQSTKNDIIKYTNADPDKIHIVNPGVDNKIYRPEAAKDFEKIKNKYNLSNNYFLVQSTLEPRKNIERIIEAYRLLPTDIKEKYSLVLAGKLGWKSAEIVKSINSAKQAGENIITTDYVVDKDLPSIYAQAKIQLVPSLYEGFGMNIVKAMASGTPVIASNNSSMTDLVGKSGILVNPTNTDEITEAITRIIYDKDLYDQLSSDGLQKSANYTWQSSAMQLKKVLDLLDHQ